MRAKSQSPPRSNFLGFTERYGVSEGDLPVDRGASASMPQEIGSGVVSDQALGGNLAGLPGHGREHGGRLFSNFPGIYGGPNRISRASTAVLLQVSPAYMALFQQLVTGQDQVGLSKRRAQL